MNINIFNNIRSVNSNNKKLSLPPLTSFPTFNNEELYEHDNSSDRKINSHFSSHKGKNASINSQSKSIVDKSESELEKENILDNTPSFSQEFSLSNTENENSFN